MRESLFGESGAVARMIEMGDACVFTQGGTTMLSFQESYTGTKEGNVDTAEVIKATLAPHARTI